MSLFLSTTCVSPQGLSFLCLTLLPALPTLYFQSHRGGFRSLIQEHPASPGQLQISQVNQDVPSIVRLAVRMHSGCVITKCGLETLTTDGFLTLTYICNVSCHSVSSKTNNIRCDGIFSGLGHWHELLLPLVNKARPQGCWGPLAECHQPARVCA